MAGFFDFFLGNLFNPATAAQGMPPVPNPAPAPAPALTPPMAQPPVPPPAPTPNPTGGFSGFMNNIDTGIRGALDKVFGGPANPAAPTNPANLGVNADVSNPMKDPQMRKMMMMQFLSKQGGGGDENQQPQMPSPALNTRFSGGATGMGGMPNITPPNLPKPNMSSMPLPLPLRKRYIGGGY